MNAAGLAGWRPMVDAFVIWFAHFMGCWVAVELWPRQWPANALAWGFTALALGALGVEWSRLRDGMSRGELAGWNRHVGRGAVVIASVAVVFGALPSVVFLP